MIAVTRWGWAHVTYGIRTNEGSSFRSCDFFPDGMVSLGSWLWSSREDGGLPPGVIFLLGVLATWLLVQTGIWLAVRLRERQREKVK